MRDYNLWRKDREVGRGGGIIIASQSGVNIMEVECSQDKAELVSESEKKKV